MRKDRRDRKRFSEKTGKLHMMCPYKDKTGIGICIVIRGGYCYRSDDCMVLECKYNKTQSDLKSVLSVTW
jgi:hypothetical protein